MAPKTAAVKRAAENGTFEDFSVELDSKKSVTVRQFNGTNLVDIREFYIDKVTKERKPGKKGIALTESSWKKLLDVLRDIDDALNALNGGKKRKAKETVEEDDKRKEDLGDNGKDDVEGEPRVKEEEL